MAADLVLARLDAGDEYVIKPIGKALAGMAGVEVLDESPYRTDGSPKSEARFRKRSGRPAKKKTSVADAAEEKKAATRAAGESESNPDEKPDE